MIRLVRYQLADYSRSRSLFVPVVVSAIALGIIYATRPVAVLTSYGATAVVLFVVSGSVAQTISSSESPIQKEITACHAGSVVRALVGQIYAGMFVVILSSLIFIFLPWMAGVFDRDPGPKDLLVGFIAHIVGGTYGLCAGSITNRNVIKDRGVAWWTGTALLALGFAEATFSAAPATYGRMVAIGLPRGLRMGAEIAKQGASPEIGPLLPFIVHGAILGATYLLIYLLLARRRA